MNNIKLYNGVEMPVIGFGTYPINGLKLIRAVKSATLEGYRCFDTSTSYKNEFWLGKGLKSSKLRREDYFIITKVSNADQRKGNISNALNQSMKKLGVKSIDLYLMHWPNPETYLDTWKQMEDLYLEGKVKAIGVCNCHIHHLEKIMEIARINPMINEIELHPLLNQEEIAVFCSENDIKIISYSPFARMDKRLIENPTLVSLSKKYGKTITQIILRWNVQKGYVPIPKTENPERMKENMNIFDFTIDNNDIESIDKINQNIRVRHDPDNCDYSKL